MSNVSVYAKDNYKHERKREKKRETDRVRLHSNGKFGKIEISECSVQWLCLSKLYFLFDCVRSFSFSFTFIAPCILFQYPFHYYHHRIFHETF